MTTGEISISGTLLNNSKPLSDATMTGYVSGVQGVKTLKTDVNGHFSCTFSLKEIGSYNAVFT
ncbi:MAG: hypothetical protein MJ209_06315 [archaeon]|nr:hypothetical protein [archaeon]